MGSATCTTGSRVARTFVGTPPIGRNRIRWQPDKISNIDVTEWVGGHNEYKQQAVHFLVTKGARPNDDLR